MNSSIPSNLWGIEEEEPQAEFWIRLFVPEEGKQRSARGQMDKTLELPAARRPNGSSRESVLDDLTLLARQQSPKHAFFRGREDCGVAVDGSGRFCENMGTTHPLRDEQV